MATSHLEIEHISALWERTAANRLEREWFSVEVMAEREPDITVRWHPGALQRHRRPDHHHSHLYLLGGESYRLKQKTLS